MLPKWFPLRRERQRAGGGGVKGGEKAETLKKETKKKGEAPTQAGC